MEGDSSRKIELHMNIGGHSCSEDILNQIEDILNQIVKLLTITSTAWHGLINFFEMKQEICFGTEQNNINMCKPEKH